MAIPKRSKHLCTIPPCGLPARTPSLLSLSPDIPRVAGRRREIGSARLKTLQNNKNWFLPHRNRVCARIQSRSLQWRRAQLVVYPGDGPATSRCGLSRCGLGLRSSLLLAGLWCPARGKCYQTVPPIRLHLVPKPWIFFRAVHMLKLQGIEAWSLKLMSCGFNQGTLGGKPGK